MLPATIGTVMQFWSPFVTMAGCGLTLAQVDGESVGVDCNVKFPKDEGQQMFTLLPDWEIDMVGSVTAYGATSNIRRARTMFAVAGLFKLPHMTATVLPRNAARGR